MVNLTKERKHQQKLLRFEKKNFDVSCLVIHCVCNKSFGLNA